MYYSSQYEPLIPTFQYLGTIFRERQTEREIIEHRSMLSILVIHIDWSNAGVLNFTINSSIRNPGIYNNIH